MENISSFVTNEIYQIGSLAEKIKLFNKILKNSSLNAFPPYLINVGTLEHKMFIELLFWKWKI